MTSPAGGTATTASHGDGRRSVDERLFTPIRTRNTVEDITGQILDRIRAGELHEGDRLPGERVLAAAMEVSRPTLRLAIATLANAGVVDVTPGRAGGMRIASHWIPHDLLERSPLDADEIFEALEARRMLEPRVAQLSALRATDADFAAMERAIEMQRRCHTDHHKAIQADVRFHRAMWRAARNPTLEQMLVTLFRRIDVALDMASRTAADKLHAVEVHERTLAALKRADAEALDEVMDAHMAVLETICEDVFGRKAMRDLPPRLRGAAAVAARRRGGRRTA
jgi:GntR family transcriptional regulator, transcriptional repressor for pyruvate dehydrogenase complex